MKTSNKSQQKWEPKLRLVKKGENRRKVPRANKQFKAIQWCEEMNSCFDEMEQEINMKYRQQMNILEKCRNMFRKGFGENFVGGRVDRSKSMIHANGFISGSDSGGASIVESPRVTSTVSPANTAISPLSSSECAPSMPDLGAFNSSDVELPNDVSKMDTVEVVGSGAIAKKGGKKGGKKATLSRLKTASDVEKRRETKEQQKTIMPCWVSIEKLEPKAVKESVKALAKTKFQGDVKAVNQQSVNLEHPVPKIVPQKLKPLRRMTISGSMNSPLRNDCTPIRQNGRQVHSSRLAIASEEKRALLLPKIPKIVSNSHSTGPVTQKKSNDPLAISPPDRGMLPSSAPTLMATASENRSTGNGNLAQVNAEIPVSPVMVESGAPYIEWIKKRCTEMLKEKKND